MFDRYVAQSKPNWKRRAIIMASMVLHGIAGITLIVWSFIHVEEIAPPALSLTFISAPPPPPPPPPPPARKKATTEVKKTTPVEHKVVQPTVVPKVVQPKQEEPEKDEDGEGEAGGVQGGVQGGVAGGVVGGVVGGQLGGTGTNVAAPKAAPKTVASFTLIRDQLSHPSPTLPDWFKNQHAHQNMQAIYKVCLRRDGHVESVTPVTGIGGVDQIVMDQIRASWTYKPQPVEVCFSSVVKFQIN